MSHDGPIRREKRGCQKRGYVLRTVIAESQRDPSRAEAAAAEWGGDGLEAVMVKRTTSQLKKLPGYIRLNLRAPEWHERLALANTRKACIPIFDLRCDSRPT
eukprot:1943406-Pyramimonas_sp.AAC.1